MVGRAARRRSNVDRAREFTVILQESAMPRARHVATVSTLARLLCSRGVQPHPPTPRPVPPPEPNPSPRPGPPPTNPDPRPIEPRTRRS
jgi:hypothetical protein